MIGNTIYKNRKRQISIDPPFFILVAVQFDGKFRVLNVSDERPFAVILMFAAAVLFKKRGAKRD